MDTPSTLFLFFVNEKQLENQVEKARRQKGKLIGSRGKAPPTVARSRPFAGLIGS